jgi:tetratricopeptide (TPR) repeat protein
MGLLRIAFMGCCLWVLAVGRIAPAQADPLRQPSLFQPHPQRQQLLLQHLQLGKQRAREGLLHEAIGHLKYCIGLDANQVDAYFLLGLIYYHLGLSYLRETDYSMSKVLELQPEQIDALVYRGLTRMRLGAFAAAERDFQAVLSRAPDLLPLRRDLANAYLRQGKLAAAITTYKQVIDRDPDDLVARWNLRVAYAQQDGDATQVPERYRIALHPQSTNPSPVTFTDVALQLGVAALSRGRGSAWGDYDGDGDADLFTVGIKDPHHLYRNNGDGTFTEVTMEASLVDPRGGWASLAFDYDRDGDLDLFVTRDAWRGGAANSLYRNNGDGTFTDVAQQAGVAGQADSFTAVLGDVDNDGWVDIYVANGVSQANGAANALYRNNGDGTFTDVARQAGVANHGRSIGSAFGDYNNDGRLDLFVVNIDGPNALYRNNGDGSFAEVTTAAGIAAPHDGFVGFFFDYDNDGWLDLFATGWTENMAEVLSSAMSGKPSQERNRLALYHNNGDGTFTDVTTQAGLARTYGAMAAQFGDIDNDGYLDIYLGTGAPPMDTYEPNKLLWNTGRGRFVDITDSAGVGNLGKGHGATFADYDGDGDLDLYTPIGGAMFGDRQPNSLYRNNGTPHHWLKLRLIGTVSNPDAIGTRITVTTSQGARYLTVAGGTGFGSMNDPVVLIGLGTATHVDTVDIHWPSGRRQILTDLAADQRVVITEGENKAKGTRGERATP